MNRPKVIVHNVASLDGRLTLAPDCLLLYGDPRWAAAAGSADEYATIMAQRQPQAILEGSGSLALEGQPCAELPSVEGDPALLYVDFLPPEIVQQAGRKWFCVVDGRGRVRWMYKEFPGETWAGWHVLALVCRETPAAYLAYLQRERIPYLVCGPERVDLPAALDKLAGQLGIKTLVSTAGGRLNGALLRAGLIDEVEINFFPALIGGRGTPSLFDAPPLKPDENPVRLETLAVETLPNGQIHLRYRVIPA